MPQEDTIKSYMIITIWRDRKTKWRVARIVRVPARQSAADQHFIQIMDAGGLTLSIVTSMVLQRRIFALCWPSINWSRVVEVLYVVLVVECWELWANDPSPTLIWEEVTDWNTSIANTLCSASSYVHQPIIFLYSTHSVNNSLQGLRLTQVRDINQWPWSTPPWEGLFHPCSDIDSALAEILTK